RKTFFQHDVTLKFIKFVEHAGRWKIQAVSFIDLAHASFRVAMSQPRARANSVERHFVPSPIFTEDASLRFAGGGQLVVVRLKEGSLCVTNQKNASHASPEELFVSSKR